MRITHLLLSLVALLPTSMLAQNEGDKQIYQSQLQNVQTASAVIEEKALFKQPSTNQFPFEASGLSALDAYLAGYSPLTKDVLRQLAGRPIIEVLKPRTNEFQRVREYGQEEDPVMFMPKMMLKNWAREDIFLSPGPSGIQNVEDGMGCTFSMYDFDQETQGKWEVVEGTYDAYASFLMYAVEDFQYLGMALVMDRVDLSSENPLVVLDAGEMKYTLRMNSYMPDGSEFPAYVYDPQNPFPEEVDCAFETLLLDMKGFFSCSCLSENPDTYVMCSKLDRELTVTKTILYQNPENEVYIASHQITRAFDSDYTEELPCSLYRTYTSSFCLTQEDKESISGININALSYTDDVTANSSINLPVEKTVEEVSVQCCFSANDILNDQYAGVLLGIIKGSRMNEIKNGGVMILTDNGMKSCINYDFWPCYWYPEITRVKAPEQYYTKALYLLGRVSLGLNANDHSVSGVYGSLEVRGPENEHITGLKAANYITELSINGETYSSKDVIGKELNFGDFVTATYVYDNILVDQTIPSTTSLTLGFEVTNDYTKDVRPPVLNYYQIRNDKDEVVNAIDPTAGGKLYVILDDTSEFDFEVSFDPIEASEDNAQIKLDYSAAEETEMGKLYTIDLTGINLENEKWYNLHIYALDAAGNLMDQTIGYALRGIKTSGIQTIETIQENATYYDLSGRRVINPSKGIYIQEITTTQGCTVRNKVFVK